jgi:hypothetical protein
MKRMVLIIGLVSLISGCNSSGKKKADETKTDNPTGVQNVNGNIPDTTNAINLSTQKKDSASMRKDSVR